MKNLTWQNPEQLFVAQVLINKVKSKCCGIKDPYIFLTRGELYLKRGEKEKADADFNEVIRQATVARSGSCRQYALHFLGRDAEALEWMDKIIAADSTRSGGYYDKSCLLARMGRLNESVAALRKAFEYG